ncbi:hypothetical protein M9H77_06473 [Catharanthus roseus]|uniref:Uncharacterized protein n=1 Tax=Catharanthus roseus TaxID=4058 RepID=A0ACC0BSL6_CATRO|nr:hypothetical protein M9H77_06473 [Catharanthus roseus]
MGTLTERAEYLERLENDLDVLKSPAIANGFLTLANGFLGFSCQCDAVLSPGGSYQWIPKKPGNCILVLWDFETHRSYSAQSKVKKKSHYSLINRLEARAFHFQYVGVQSTASNSQLNQKGDMNRRLSPRQAS